MATRIDNEKAKRIGVKIEEMLKMPSKKTWKVIAQIYDVIHGEEGKWIYNGSGGARRISEIYERLDREVGGLLEGWRLGAEAEGRMVEMKAMRRVENEMKDTKYLVKVVEEVERLWRADLEWASENSGI